LPCVCVQSASSVCNKGNRCFVLCRCQFWCPERSCNRAHGRSLGAPYHHGIADLSLSLPLFLLAARRPHAIATKQRRTRSTQLGGDESVDTASRLFSEPSRRPAATPAAQTRPRCESGQPHRAVSCACAERQAEIQRSRDSTQANSDFTDCRRNNNRALRARASDSIINRQSAVCVQRGRQKYRGIQTRHRPTVISPIAGETTTERCQNRTAKLALQTASAIQ
jgi:hypothetical protein